MDELLMNPLIEILRKAKQGYRITIGYDTDRDAYQLIAHRVGREDYDRLYINGAAVRQAVQADVNYDDPSKPGNSLSRLIQREWLDRIL